MSTGAWTEEEVKALLAIWGESKIQQELDGAVRNKVVFTTIAKKLNEKGCSRKWDQCRNKIKNLKKKYREVKDHNSLTGRGRATCKYYDILDRILGHRPASEPIDLLDSTQVDVPNDGDVVAESPLEEAAQPELSQETAVETEQPAGESGADLVQLNDEVIDTADKSSEPAKEPKQPPKKTRAERATEKLLQNFITYQKEADAAFGMKQEERWQRQFEAEERRRRQEQDHELQVLQMLMSRGQANYGCSSQPYYTEGPYDNY